MKVRGYNCGISLREIVCRDGDNGGMLMGRC